MDDVLMRPMFRDAYISKQKQQMKKLKTGGLASIKKFNLGGSVSFTPEEKQAYMLAPVIGSLLQGQKTQGGSFGELVSGTLGDIGRGISQVPAIGLNIKKIEATGAAKSRTTKAAFDNVTGKKVFVTNRDIIEGGGRYSPIDKASDFENMLKAFSAKEDIKEQQKVKKAQREKVSAAETELGNSLKAINKVNQVIKNIDKGAFTGNLADFSIGISGALGGAQSAYSRVMADDSDSNPNYNQNIQTIESALQKQFGPEFGKLEQQNKTIMTGLMYDILAIKEPGGRYSDRDAERIAMMLGRSSNPELFKTGMITTVGGLSDDAILNWELATKKKRTALEDTPYAPVYKFVEIYKNPSKKTKEKKKERGSGVNITDSSPDFVVKKKRQEPKETEKEQFFD